MKKLIWKIVLAASLLLMVIAATNIVLLIREYQKGINTYANLEKSSKDRRLPLILILITML